jgi:hypothetical protein
MALEHLPKQTGERAIESRVELGCRVRTSHRAPAGSVERTG